MSKARVPPPRYWTRASRANPCCRSGHPGFGISREWREPPPGKRPTHSGLIRSGARTKAAMSSPAFGPADDSGQRASVRHADETTCRTSERPSPPPPARERVRGREFEREQGPGGEPASVLNRIGIKPIEREQEWTRIGVP